MRTLQAREPQVWKRRFHSQKLARSMPRHRHAAATLPYARNVPADLVQHAGVEQGVSQASGMRQPLGVVDRLAATRDSLLRIAQLQQGESQPSQAREPQIVVLVQTQ